MKDGLVFVVGLALIAGLGLLLVRYYNGHASTAAARAADNSAPLKEEARPVPKLKHRVKEAAPKVWEEPVAAVLAPEVVTPVAPAPPPFPTVEQIAVGTEKPRITAMFGNPSIAAVTTDRGHLVETFVYKREKGLGQTFISFEDGRVLSAYSTYAHVRPVGRN